jgi:hypothetical protein
MLFWFPADHGLILRAQPGEAWVKFYQPGVPTEFAFESKPVFALFDETAARWPLRDALVPDGAAELPAIVGAIHRAGHRGGDVGERGPARGGISGFRSMADFGTIKAAVAGLVASRWPGGGSEQSR